MGDLLYDGARGLRPRGRHGARTPAAPGDPVWAQAGSAWQRVAHAAEANRRCPSARGHPGPRRAWGPSLSLLGLLGAHMLPLALGFGAAGLGTGSAAWMQRRCHHGGGAWSAPQRRQRHPGRACAGHPLVPRRAGAAAGDGEEEEAPVLSGAAATNTTKSMSPLAMAAADWLEDEEDELAAYWDRFDAAKRGDGEIKGSPAASGVSSPLLDADTTTEERLDSYYESRGIDKAAEATNRRTIESAVEEACAAGTESQECFLYTADPKMCPL